MRRYAHELWTIRCTRGTSPHFFDFLTDIMTFLASRAVPQLG